MSDTDELDRKDLDIIRDFNDAAEGLEDRYDADSFSFAGDRLSRKYGNLMASARTGLERGELMESMAGVLIHLADQPFKPDDSMRNYEIVTRALRKLGDAFVLNMRPDTVPAHYSTEQLEVVAGRMKSAAEIRENLAGYFPNRPGTAAIIEQAETYRKLGEDIAKATAKLADLAGEKPKPAKLPRSTDRPVRTRF